MLYVVNYANERYKSQQEFNTKSAYERGKADKVIEFHEEDIEWMKSEFPEHFQYARGGGLWIWKPWVCLKALEQIEDGDYLFYCDSGQVFINDIHMLLPDFGQSGKDIMVFEQSLLSICYTKHECYELMDWHDYSGNQILSGYILMRKSKTSMSYMQEWFDNMKDIRKAHGEHYCPEIKEFMDFISHREDQSVLDVLRQKWGIEGHRDPSDFGEFPWQYAMAGGFHRKKYPNSHYPTLLLCVRKEDPISYETAYRNKVEGKRSNIYYDLVTWKNTLPNQVKHLGKVILTICGLYKPKNK